MNYIRKKGKNSRHICDGIFDPNNNALDLRFHRIFMGMNRRCGKEGPRKDVKNKWKNFKEFYYDMYPSYMEHIKQYGVKQTTIDRIDPKGDYCKENCRRATYSEQLSNRRNLDHYIIGGKKYRLSELKEMIGITERKIINRYHKYIEGKYTEEQMLYKGRMKGNHLVKAGPI